MLSDLKPTVKIAGSTHVTFTFHVSCTVIIIIMVSFDSGSLLTLETTRHPMPFIQLSLACLESNYMHVVNTQLAYYCIYIVKHINYYTLTRTHTHTYDSTKRILACATVSRKEHVRHCTNEGIWGHQSSTTASPWTRWYTSCMWTLTTSNYVYVCIDYGSSTW